MKPVCSDNNEIALYFPQLPSSWNTLRLKYLLSATLSYGASEAAEYDDRKLPRYIRITDFAEDGSLKEETFKSLPYEIAKDYLLSDGDILFARSGSIGKTFQYRGLNGKACHAGYLIKGSVNPKVILSDFLYLYTKSAIYENWKNGTFIQTTIQNINAEKYSQLLVPVPPLYAQSAIVSLLKEETSRIDALISKKERQIELLQEKRQAIITHAVTKGLDPNANMKDSDVGWIGMTPSLWGVHKLRRVAKMESGHTPDKEHPEYWTESEGIPWVSLNDTKFLAKNDYISDTAFHTTDLGLQNSSAHLLPSEVVLFTRDATIGACAITTVPMAVSQHIIAWVCGKNLIPKFLLRLFDAMKQELDRLTMGATVKTIGMPDIYELAIPLPPVNEQKRILDFVDGNIEGIDSAVEKVVSSISLLQEYRSSLITAAVSGQVDVSKVKEKAPA